MMYEIQKPVLEYVCKQVTKKTGGGNNLGTRQRPGNMVGTRLTQMHNTNSSAADYNYFRDFLIGGSPSPIVWCF